MNTRANTPYGPALAALVGDRPMPLGPGRLDSTAQAALQHLDLNQLFAGQTIRDSSMARCCLSGLWLRHNGLDESHTISQDIPSAEGSYWHGIMHRREPDYGNAKYWFRNVGPHAVFPALCAEASELAPEAPAVTGGQWDPFAFVDMCESAARSANEDLCRQIQDCEWRLLFEHCFQRAVEG